jgi:hypothetical protein
MAPSLRTTREEHTTSRVEVSSPFHIALLSRAKICGLSRYANLEIRITRCLLPSVVKDRRSVHQRPIGTSPLPVEREISFGTEVASNKKTRQRAPGMSVHSYGLRLRGQPPERICSILVLLNSGACNQLHLWLSDLPGLSGQSPAIPRYADIRRV